MLKTFYIFIFCLLSVLKIEGQNNSYKANADCYISLGNKNIEGPAQGVGCVLCENEDIIPIQVTRTYSLNVPPPVIDSVEIYFSNIYDLNTDLSVKGCDYLFNNELYKVITIYPSFSYNLTFFNGYQSRALDTSVTVNLLLPTAGVARPAHMLIVSKFYGSSIGNSYDITHPDSLPSSDCSSTPSQILLLKCSNVTANFQNDTICLNDSLQIQNLSNHNGDSYKWQFTGANISEAYGFAPPLVKYATPGVYPVTLIGGNIPCQGAYHPYFCFPRGSSDTITKNIVVLPAPSFNFDFTDTSLCVGDSLFLDAAVNDASVTYTWSNGKNTPQIWVTEDEFIKVILQNHVACAAQDSIFITWNAAPTVSLSAPKTAICEGQSVTITATTLLQQQLIWNTGENTFSITVQDSGWYWAEVNNNCGLDRDSLFINVIPDIDTVALPNIITPNADGINDEYTFAAMNDLESYDIFVYNRWGNLVFTGNQQTAPWQGNTNAGENLADGVYFVLFNYKNCEQELISLKKAVYVMR